MERILVMDDSAAYRELTCLALRMQGFEAVAAGSAFQGLNLAQDLKPNLIVMDVDFPDANGLDCLERLRKNPETANTPVIIVTGHHERDYVVRAAKLGASGFLLKDCFTPQRFFQQVRGALSGNGPRDDVAPGKGRKENGSRDPRSDVTAARKTVVAHADHQPEHPPKRAGSLCSVDVLAKIKADIVLKAIPPVLEYVLRLANSRDSSFKEIADVIRQDHALAFKVLQVSNSSYAGGTHRAKTIHEAAQRIGTRGIRDIATVILVIENFSAGSHGGLNLRRFWEHSLATAMLSDEIGAELKSANRDDLYLAGLFHDLGRLILASSYPGEYGNILNTAQAADDDLEIQEKRAFGISCSDVTRLVLQQWNCGAHLTDLIPGMQNDSGRAGRKGNSSPSSTVALANGIAHATAFGDSGHSVLLPIRGLLETLDLSNDQLHRIWTKAVARAQESEILLASASTDSPSASMSQTLRNQLQAPFRAAVFSDGAPHDELSIWSECIGILSDHEPNVALVHGRRHADGRRLCEALKQYEAPLGYMLPTILLVEKSERPGFVAPFREREMIVIHAPFWYSRIINALNSLKKKEPKQALPA